MTEILKLFTSLFLLAAALTPSPAAAAGLSFGGTITSIYPFCMNGNIWMHIVPALGSHPNQIYVVTPGTLISSKTPPNHTGQQVLGLSAGPGTGYCVITYWPYTLFMPFGEAVILVGASEI